MLSGLVFGSLPLAAMIPIGIISSLITVALGAKSYKSAWNDLKVGAIGMDTLFSLSTILGLSVSLASLFVPWLPMMFDAGLLIFGFRYLGMAIKNTIKERAIKSKYQDRVAKMYQKVTFESDSLTECAANDIQPEDTILLQPGETIPIDGLLLDEGDIINTITNGSNTSERYQSNTHVYAGMRLAEYSAPVTIKATQSARESLLARMDRDIEKSLLEKSSLEVRSQNILKWFIPSIIGIAILSGLIIGMFFPASLAIQCAISVLVSACPCTLGMITGLAVETGYKKGLDKGIKFKSGRIIEIAEQIDTVVFDLNGTLTTGVPNLTQIISEWEQTELLSLVQALEQEVVHPVGAAIYKYCQEQHIPSLELQNKKILNHLGTTATHNGKQYAIGNAALMAQLDVDLDSIEHHLLKPGDSAVYVSEDQKIIAKLVITDPLRADAAKTIQALYKMGKNVHICTGADQRTADRYGNVLGIESANIHGNCFPIPTENHQSKTELIQYLQQQKHKVAMIGDGGNDANGIVLSDLGIAILSKHGDEKTQAEADIILSSDTLLAIPKALAISKQTVINIRQNISISLAYNIASIILASGLLLSFGITLNPGVGVALMAVQACIVLFNVYRFKNQAVPKFEELDIETLPTDTSTSRMLGAMGTSTSLQQTPNPIYHAIPNPATRSFKSENLEIVYEQSLTF